MLNEILQKYWGLRFWGKKRHYHLVYIIIYLLILLPICFFLKFNSTVHDPFIVPVFFGFFPVFFFYGIPNSSFINGLSEYLHEYDDNLRRNIFDDKYIKGGSPISSTFGLFRFMRMKDDKLDKTLTVIRDNFRSFHYGVIVYFIVLFTMAWISKVLGL